MLCQTGRRAFAAVVLTVCPISRGQGAAGRQGAQAATLVRNASFEADGVEIKGVGYTRQGNRITAWEVGGDRECARNPVGGPFFDSGRAPHGKVAVVIQNRSRLRQEVGPFVRDRVYRLRLRANGRAADARAYGRHGRLEVRLNSTRLLGPVEVKSVEPYGSHDADFTVLEALFYTGGGKYPLELMQTDPADGISVLVDDVRVEPVEVPLAAAIRVNRARARPTSRPVTEVNFRDAQWIWSPEQADPLKSAPPGTRFFRRIFEVDDPNEVKRAFIVAAADNRAEVFANGAFLGTAAGFSRWYEMEFTEALRPGRMSSRSRHGTPGTAPIQPALREPYWS